MNEYYHRFNENLMTKLNNTENSSENKNGLKPDFKTPAVSTAVKPDTPQNIENDNLTGEGGLIVTVTLARGAIPVEGATVIIAEENNKSIISTHTTDKSGRTEKISLPTQSSALSLTPDSSVRPFSVYNIRAEYPGYYTEDAINVPIFDKVISIQPIALIPLSEKDIAEGELVINESQVLAEKEV